MAFSNSTPLRLMSYLFLLPSLLTVVSAEIFHRNHEESEARSVIPRDFQSLNLSAEFDTISVENYLRDYRHGSPNDRHMLSNHDLIGVYVGPYPENHPNEHDSPIDANGIIRTWAMFDKKTRHYCLLNGIHQWGQLALFNCPHEGVYRAYAIDTRVDDGIPPATPITLRSNGKSLLGWFSKSQKVQFDLLGGNDLRVKIFNLPNSQERVQTQEERMEALEQWSLGKDFEYMDQSGNLVTLTPHSVVTSDPVRVKESYYCYYWMYSLREVGRKGYIDHEIVPYVSRDPKSDMAIHKKEPWSAYILLELLIWIAEPSGVDVHETWDTKGKLFVSEYSRVITKRYSETGLFPCLRKAHSSVEVVQAIAYVSESDPNSALYDTPHWRVLVKIHTDRLISTLSDITFTIASRQNTASFHCFVGETRVFYSARHFSFVPMRKLEANEINLNISKLSDTHKSELKFDKINAYGHGVHHIGYKWSKKYQAASYRSDMTVITNPCIAQEFVFSVGGSLYMAENLLRKGVQHAKKIVLPKFSTTQLKKEVDREYLRVFDVAFTPTHLVFLMKDSNILLHPSSVKTKGLAEISEVHKHRLDAFVKRRWCPRTASPKLSAQMLPIFGEEGTVIILQIYPTEGNVAMWVMPPAPTCLPEGAGFVQKLEGETHVIDEKEIHFNEYASVVRTNQKTGLVEPPIPLRPPPPPPPYRDIYEEKAFILDTSREFVVEGEDPHFPLRLLNPASHVLEKNLKDYNHYQIYDVESDSELRALLTSNGLTLKSVSSKSKANDILIRIHAMEFTVAEKEFVFSLNFNSEEIDNAFKNPQPSFFQAIITTLTVTNFPYRVKTIAHNAPASSDDGRSSSSSSNEKLDTVTPFPAVILVRMKHYHVDVPRSRDPKEFDEHNADLDGTTQVPFGPEIHTLGTAIPSYVVHLGDVLMFSSIESRYARPLHYYPWNVLDEAERNASAGTHDAKKPLFFNDSSIRYGVKNLLYDMVLTEQGMISVLRRKHRRHLVQDDEICSATPDTETQRVIMGSVITLEGLRELKPFFRNDNIFQRTTPDGEIIYGTYDVQARSSFRSCPEDRNRIDTASDMEPCVEQATKTLSNHLIPVCTKDERIHDKPCRDPGYLEYCEEQGTPIPIPTHACLRKNDGCTDVAGRFDEKDAYDRPVITDPAKCDTIENKVATSCMPEHAPREEIRTVNILGTSYHSYLQGSLQTVRTLHPEADTDNWRREVEEEPDICPFVSFQVYHKDIDFAEVGYQIRVTAQVSYIGTETPAEADIIVEYERTMGVVVEISTSVEEVRQLTKIVKAVDIHFHMPDYKLEQLMSASPAEKHHQRTLGHDFEDVRAREKFSVFSVTFRPSIVNLRCKSTELFKTVQFNVGCNPFSNIRLMSEATTLKAINWTETLDEHSGFQWHRDYNQWTLTIPKIHIFYKQLKRNVFKCDKKPNFCEIPYFHLFKNDIYTLSYRDYFRPKFEQFLTVSSRPVTANVVLYDLLGSNRFNWTLNKYKAGCHNAAHFWYEKLLRGTKDINRETFEHENVYLYYRDCFDVKESMGSRENLQRLLSDPFYFFNVTNNNSLKFLRNRNEIFIFRAVIMNTYHNRFTYCKQLDTFFMVRITGIPIPRQGLALWQYILTILLVSMVFVIWYLTFARFYTWTVSRT